MATSDEANVAESPSTAPTADTDEPKREGPPFPVVGIGASAGGLEAISELLANLSADPGLALLFVLHLEPQHKSHLAELLGRVSPIPIREATQSTKIEINHGYVIPPNTMMTMADGHLTLSPRSPVRSQNMPIDHLFRSLAHIQKSRAIAVIMSGGGTDGVLGFQAIRAEGGITITQDEKSARHASMPRSAAQDGHVDYVLPPQDIGKELVRVSHHSYTRQGKLAPEVVTETADKVNELIAMLRVRSGVDFTHYKSATIRRRIERRMALRGVEQMNDYVEIARKDPNELHRLYEDCLIRVTQFFRDPEAFEALKENVFPKLVQGRSAETPIRIWSAGCSSGEEVYSLAICLLEFLGAQSEGFPIKILATDLNEAALETARSGTYLDNIEIDVSTERLRRYFIKTGTRYQISKSVRDLCVFSRHNLASDPPFFRVDLVSCRNVLIYMDTSLQRRVLPILHYSLARDGFLFLGSSESVGTFTELFETVDGRQRIFRKKMSASAVQLEFSAFPTAEGMKYRVARQGGQELWSALDVQKEADRLVLSRYAPVGVVVDETGTVVQFRGRTVPYLEPAPGMASLDLFRMLREGLLSEVRAAFNKARTDNVPVVKENLPLADSERIRRVRAEVTPFHIGQTSARFFLVSFEGMPEPGADTQAKQLSPAPVPLEASQLQQEVAAVREYLQSVIEEQESTTEELKSANEEILSANEELQSTNEELQTAKEEAQSANEELATVNDELRHRNVELARVNNDLINLLSGVNIPIVMVSRDLRVRRFTPPAERIFNLIQTDIGRPFSDLKPNLVGNDLTQVITGVIDTLMPYEGGIKDKDGHAYCLRVRPYVTMDNKIDGASIVLLDADAVLRVVQQMDESSSEPEKAG